ncbi:MAG: hypothetical protein FJ149_02215 [Euryarchaeota archaeon]|nr:hypothetical protein [Euryarchaeota archaeon]
MLKGRAGWVIALALGVVLGLPAVPSESAPAGASASARGEFVQDQTVELGFDNETFQNLSFSISLPSNSTIHSASVDLEGRPVVGPDTGVACDFSGDTKDYVGYKGTYSKNAPGTARPTSFQGTQMQGSDLGRVAYLDGTYAEQYAYSWNGEYGYHHFKFKLPLDMVDNLTVTWNGYSGYYYKSGSYTYGGYGTSSVYIWNNQSLEWEYVGNVSGAPKTVSKWFNGSAYLDGTGCVHVLSLTKSGWAYSGSYAYNNMDTDYVRVCATGNVLLYPKDPLMDIGANGRVEWSLDVEEFDFMVNVCDYSLVQELQTLVKNSPGRFTPIKFRFRSQAEGFIAVSNLTISYNAPPWCRGIPDTYVLDEDTPAGALIDLNRFFDDDQGRLQYEITYEEDAKKLDAEISADGHSLDFKPPTRNWWGEMRFRVKATDPENVPLSAESNAFRVTVRPVNDPPVLQYLMPQVAFEETPFRLTVSVRDVDMDLDPAEKVAFSDNTDLFDIHPGSGKIEFTPAQEQVGSYNIQIAATDLAGARDERNFTLEVRNMPDAPSLQSVPDLEAPQDQPFSFRVRASDPDIPYGDGLNFSDDTPLFDIDPLTGLIQFVPSGKDVGRHPVTVRVTDTTGLCADRKFNLTVLNTIGNIDRPPAIQAVGDQTAVEGRPFELAVKASDPDLPAGDLLEYSDDCPLFDIDPDGRIAFTPRFEDAGIYNVSVTVRDRDGLSASAAFVLTVLTVNHAPEITALSPEEGSNYTTGARIVLRASATDLDGDALNYTWKEGGIILGHGEELGVSFEEVRTYFITLSVSDGDLEATRETSVVVLEPPPVPGLLGSPGAPGFGTVLAVLALAGAAVALAARRRKG